MCEMQRSVVRIGCVYVVRLWLVVYLHFMYLNLQL